MTARYTAIATVSFGGFTAALLEGENIIVVRANDWKGTEQPRIVLHKDEPSFNDWRRLLTPTPWGTVDLTRREVEFAEHAGD